MVSAGNERVTTHSSHPTIKTKQAADFTRARASLKYVYAVCSYTSVDIAEATAMKP